jgi:hypothetical protein
MLVSQSDPEILYNHLLPYPVLGAAQAGKGGSVHPDGAVVIVYVLV